MNLGLIDYAIIFGCVCGAFYLAAFAATMGDFSKLLAKAVKKVESQLPNVQASQFAAIPTGSKRFRLTLPDFTSALRHFIVPIAAGAIVYLTQLIPGIDQTNWIGILTFSALTGGIRLLQLFVQNNQQ